MRYVDVDVAIYVGVMMTVPLLHDRDRNMLLLVVWHMDIDMGSERRGE